MRKLDEPVELYHDVRLSHLPVGWKVSSERKKMSTELKIHTSDWGIFVCASLDNSDGFDDAHDEEAIKSTIRHVCDDRPFTISYSDFRKHYPSDKALVAEYSRFEPGEMFADRQWLNRSQQEKVVVGIHCLKAFGGRAAAKVPHESLDVFVGSSIGLEENRGGGSTVGVKAFRRDSSEGIVFIIWPSGKKYKAMLAKHAGNISRVSAALIDGLTPCGKTKRD